KRPAPSSSSRLRGNQYYPGVQWDVRDSAWRYITILDLPFSLVFDTLLLPLDASHGPYN
ncbi:YceK/YidQ family lipoprotein, partial [Klebsiella michiganensis]|uniref:YceK/YidQ family lipoprotein n=1 Tax=Klebsiella michiganensis TaxID=1134687 RepID=UPI00191D263C